MITRLGEGVAASGRLSAAAIARTVAVLSDFGDAIRASPCDRIVLAATSAARDAGNFEDFAGAAKSAIGVEPEVVTGLREAELAFAGATIDLPRGDGPFLVLDIGGGSTEFVIGNPGAPPAGAHSADIGSVRITERFLASDPPSARELSDALAFVEDHLVDVERAVPVSDSRRLVGIAGTITTLAATALRLDSYDPARTHLTRLGRETIEELFRRMASESVEELREDPAIDPARADVIVGGALVLVGVMRRWPFAEVVVSETDILDGLALSLVERDHA